MNLLFAYDLATVSDDDALHVSVDGATAEVEDTLGAVGVDGADDGPDGVRTTAFTGVVAAAEHHGEAAGTVGHSGLEVGTEGTDVGTRLGAGHLVPDAVALQDVCWLLRVVERAVGNGGGSAHELVGGAVDGCGASLLFVIPSA